jgi:hypothetical protein
VRGGMRGGRWVLRVLRHRFESRSEDLRYAEGCGVFNRLGICGCETWSKIIKILSIFISVFECLAILYMQAPWRLQVPASSLGILVAYRGPPRSGISFVMNVLLFWTFCSLFNAHRLQSPLWIDCIRRRQTC